ncbi:MAG: cysteine synthase family protein [Campylobacterota bacterium]|nr:cysteine synthase family protein [Campylobacterota bacterium]
MSDKYLNKLEEISESIGNTKLYAIDFKLHGEKRRVYSKCECGNFTGSAKDRMAINILKEAYRKGEIAEGYHIVEATSGNTGIALAAIGKELGHRVTIFMPDWLSVERQELIRGYGAEIILVSREEGGFMGSIERAKELAEKEPNSFLANQFSNKDNMLSHYRATGPEIYEQIMEHEENIDAFVAGVGTGGVVMGVGNYLREKNPAVKIHPLEPGNSPTLSTGHKVGAHRIEGISDEFIPSILELDFLDDVISVDDGDAICMAQKLERDLGLEIGISSGANFLGAVLAQDMISNDAVVATIFTDDNKKYKSTDLNRVEQIKCDFISSDIELLGVAKIEF